MCRPEEKYTKVFCGIGATESLSQIIPVGDEDEKGSDQQLHRYCRQYRLECNLSVYTGIWCIAIRHFCYRHLQEDKHSGASYFGVMDMTGNCGEYGITLCTVAGRSCRYVPNSDGAISANGNARLTVCGAGFWPGMEGNVTSSTANTCAGTCEVTGNAAVMVRGGHWISSPGSVLAVSYRISALPQITPRYEGHGGRSVLYVR